MCGRCRQIGCADEICAVFLDIFAVEIKRIWRFVRSIYLIVICDVCAQFLGAACLFSLAEATCYAHPEKTHFVQKKTNN